MRRDRLRGAGVGTQGVGSTQGSARLPAAPLSSARAKGPVVLRPRLTTGLPLSAFGRMAAAHPSRAGRPRGGSPGRSPLPGVGAGLHEVRAVSTRQSPGQVRICRRTATKNPAASMLESIDGSKAEWIQPPGAGTSSAASSRRAHAPGVAEGRGRAGRPRTARADRVPARCRPRRGTRGCRSRRRTACCAAARCRTARCRSRS